MSAAPRRLGMLSIGGAAVLTVIGAIVFAVMASGGEPPVIRLVGGGERAATADAAMTMQESAPGGDLTLWQPVEYRFVLADSARFDAGAAPAWRLQPPADLRERAERLAGILGVDGLEDAPRGEGGYVAGGMDGSGPSLWVGPRGDWSYHDPTAFEAPGCAMPGYDGDGDRSAPDVEAERPSEGGGEDSSAGSDRPAPEDTAAGREPAIICEEPEPPGNVPTAAQARDSAVELFDAVGTAGRLTGIEASASEWGAWVHAGFEVGGLSSGLSVSAGFGGDGVLTSASGTLAEPVEVADYPTIDAEAAVARLSDGHAFAGGWFWPGLRGGPELTASPDRAVTSDAVDATADLTEPAEPADATDDPADPTGDPAEPTDDPAQPTDDPAEPTDDPAEPTDDPAEPTDDPAEPTDGPDEPTSDIDKEPGRPQPLPQPGEDPEPEVVTVTLVDVEPSLMLLVDADGDWWLLPAYRFGDDADGYWQVLAVEDGYVEIDTGPPMTDPEPLPAPIDPPTDQDPGEPVEPGEPLGEFETLAREVLGMGEDEATALLEAEGATVRVVARDGERFPVTEDYRIDRVNLHIERGRVTEATVG